MLLFFTDKIRRIVTCAALGFSVFLVSAQQQYWQQELRYKMEVSLNDSLHTLNAFSTIQYKNNGPVALSEIFFHLWPNAYRDNNTALARQHLQRNNLSLYYSTEQERGYIDSLDFRINGEVVKWNYDPVHRDICRLELPKPLASGDSIIITTPFFLKIPSARFSRLGHTGQAYYMTQWYPKPAVYDHKGWHIMPYLDQGEFYSEFASFDVSITLPANYVLAATGDRINAQKEMVFLREKVEETSKLLASDTIKSGKKADDFPRSDSLKKTVRFVQSNVHDFAWFADKRFLVQKSSLQLESGRVVDTYVFFTPGNKKLWKDATTYVNDAVAFYSKKVGEYPYRHCTAVDGTIMAGGGMEYPNITVIGNSGSALELDMVITHEVGHNWFYGMLGSNERRFPFLDEGLNSFYELLYMRSKYRGKPIAMIAGKDSTFKLLGVNKLPLWSYHGISYALTQTLRKEQRPHLHSDDYSSANYGAIIYSKIAVALDYLLMTAGEEKFDAAMKEYFGQFRFKHPYPENLEEIFVKHGVADRQLFADLFYSTRSIDYKLSRVKKQGDSIQLVKVKNRGEVAGPFLLSACDKNKVCTDTVLQGFKGSRTFTFNTKATSYVIDPESRMPEINRSNNFIRSSGLFPKMRPIKLQLLSGFGSVRESQLYYLPLPGGNYYNGLMLGLALHNYGVMQKKFEWALAPMFGFRSRSPAGFADAEYKFFSDGVISQVNAGIGFRSFSFYDAPFTGEGSGFAHFYRFAPYLEFIPRKKAVSHISQRVVLAHFLLSADSTASKPWNPFQQLSTWQVSEFRYLFSNSHPLYPYNADFRVQRAGNVVKSFVTFNYSPALNKKNRMQLRLFAGMFLSGSEQERSFYAFRPSGYNGYHDYTLSHHFVGRNERSGVGFSQFAEEDGNMKAWTPLGQSVTWMMALNVRSPKILRTPFRVFADAVISEPLLNSNIVLWDAGLSLTVVKDIIDVYYAFIYHDEVGRILDLNNIHWANRIRFTFNINRLVPKRLVRDLSF